MRRIQFTMAYAWGYAYQLPVGTCLVGTVPYLFSSGGPIFFKMFSGWEFFRTPRNHENCDTAHLLSAVRILVQAVLLLNLGSKILDLDLELAHSFYHRFSQFYLSTSLVEIKKTVVYTFGMCKIVPVYSVSQKISWCLNCLNRNATQHIMDYCCVIDLDVLFTGYIITRPISLVRWTSHPLLCQQW